MFLHMSVILFTGGSLPQCVLALVDPRGGARDVCPPWGSKFFHFHAVFDKNLKYDSNFGSWRTPLGKILDTPLAGIPPFPPGADPPPQEQTPLEQSPPKGQIPPRSRPCWEIRATSGRYAYYWNAILYFS